MRDRIENIYRWFNARSTGQLRSHVRAIMGNGGLQAINQVGQTYTESLNPWVTLGTAFPQMVISFRSIFVGDDTELHERALQALKTGFAATEVGLSIALIYTGDTCVDVFTNDLCTTLAVFQTLYISALVISGGAALLPSNPNNNDSEEEEANQRQASPV